MVAGWLLYALSYVALSRVHGVRGTLVVMGIYGLYHALSEGAEKSLLTSLVPAAARGRAFGLYNGLVGGASLAAGLLFGAVWTRWGSSVAFIIGGDAGGRERDPARAAAAAGPGCLGLRA